MTLNSEIHTDGPGSIVCATTVTPEEGCFAWLETHMVCVSGCVLVCREAIELFVKSWFCKAVTDPVCTFDQNRNFRVLWQLLIDQAPREWKRQDKGTMAGGGMVG